MKKIKNTLAAAGITVAGIFGAASAAQAQHDAPPCQGSDIARMEMVGGDNGPNIVAVDANGKAVCHMSAEQFAQMATPGKVPVTLPDNKRVPIDLSETRVPIDMSGENQRKPIIPIM